MERSSGTSKLSTARIPQPAATYSITEQESRHGFVGGWTAPSHLPSTPGNRPDAQCAAALRRFGISPQRSAPGDYPESRGAGPGTTGSHNCRHDWTSRHDRCDAGESGPWNLLVSSQRDEQSLYSANQLSTAWDCTHGATGYLHRQAKARFRLCGEWLSRRRAGRGPPGDIRSRLDASIDCSERECRG